MADKATLEKLGEELWYAAGGGETDVVKEKLTEAGQHNHVVNWKHPSYAGKSENLS